MEQKVTWDELANLYQKQTGRPARILPMDVVFRWAERQSDKFYVNDAGELCKIKEESNVDS